MLKGRLEDDRMLTGRGKYVSDWNLPGQAHAHFVRSDRAHAEIVSIDSSAALAHPGVLAVFTGEDIKGVLKSLPCALPVKGRGGMELIHPGRPALAQGRVRFTGEPVEEICRFAKNLGVDLVVVGHNQKTSFAARWWKGSVGASLLDYSPCSILIALSKS